MKDKEGKKESPAKGMRGFIFTYSGRMTFRVYGKDKRQFTDYDVHQSDLQVRIIGGARYSSLYCRPGRKWSRGDGNLFLDYPRKVLAGGRAKRVPYDGYDELDARGTEGRLYLNGDGRHWDLAVKLRCTEPKCGCGGAVIQTLYYHVCHDDIEVEIIDGHASAYEVGGKEFIDLSSKAMRPCSKEEVAKAVDKGRRARQLAARFHPDKFFDCQP